ncbi:MAG: cytochrome P450 [Oligoflexales bacterium]|nr:cytochrome P450 [Oligoflexales bacterium]
MLHQNSYYHSFIKLIGLYSSSKGDLYSFLQEVNSRYGDKVSCRTPNKSIHFLFCKEAVNNILVKRERDFGKTQYTLQLNKLLGNGLLTSEGKLWQHNRKLIQPFFKKQSLQTITTSLEQEVEDYFDKYTASMGQKSLPINIVEFIHPLILSLTAKTLFGLNIENHTHEISNGIQLFVDYTSQGAIGKQLFSYFTKKKIQRFRQKIEEIMLDQIKHEQDKPTNFLSFLLNQNKEHPGSMGHRQIVDEALTMLFAGHETTANILCWTFVELANHMNWQDRLISSARQFRNQTPTMSEVQNLMDFDWVFMESARQYPPGWVLAREARKDLNLLDIEFNEKDLVVIPTWFIHRSKTYWKQANCFDPERFANKQGILHDGSFFPFSMGARTCIGRQLAHVQANLILANFFKRFRIRLLQPKPEPLFHVLLRPPVSIKASLEKI